MNSNTIIQKMLKFNLNIVLILMVFFISCSKEISPIEYGKDQCEQCRMTITDQKYGAEIISKKGKTFKFDAAECMLNFVNAKKIDANEVEKYFVVNLAEPGKLIDAVKAVYLISPNLRSPMGGNISSFADMTMADKYIKENSGVIYKWDELKNKYK